MRVLIAGDFCDNGRVSSLISKNEYDSLFSDVKSIIQKADYSILNFEFPLLDGDITPINKVGPCLFGQINSIQAIKYAGFNCATLANNHILDQGEGNCLNTKIRLEDAGVDTVGVGKNTKDANRILYKTINGEILAVINCCEHEFSIATETTAGANALNPVQQFYSIQEARKNADYVLVIVHGGHEHFQLPSPRMKESYRFFIDAGADAVVNHHQHCYSGYERYKGKLIFYGLGNLCFDSSIKMGNKWYEGYMVSIFFSSALNFEIHPYIQCKEKPIIKTLTPSESDVFFHNVEKLNTIIKSDSLLEREYLYWVKQGTHSIECLISPYTNKLIRKFAEKKWLPTFVNQKRKTEILAYIQCESHLERLLAILRD